MCPAKHSVKTGYIVRGVMVCSVMVCLDGRRDVYMYPCGVYVDEGL